MEDIVRKNQPQLTLSIKYKRWGGEVEHEKIREKSKNGREAQKQRDRKSNTWH